MKTSNFIVTSSLVFLISLLFLFPSSVNAWTYDATITDTDFAYLDNLSSQRSIVENAIPNNSFYSSSYMTYYNTYDSQYYTFIVKSGNTPGSANFVNWTSGNGLYFNAINAFGYICRLNFNSNSLESCSLTNATASNLLYNRKYITYINFNYPIRNDENTNTLVFHYNNDTYQLTNGDYIVSLDNLKDIFLTPPTPTDNYPLLTNFYSLVIDRLSFITEEFSSNYLYTSFFVIFIIMAIIFTIKRRLL